MARRQVTIYVDDVTNEEVTQLTTEIVCVEGVAWEVDMGPETLAAYRKAVEPYRSAGRRLSRAETRGNVMAAPVRTKPMPDREQTRAMREWWKRNEASDELPPHSAMGRVPWLVQEAFQRHGGRPIEMPPEVVKPSKTPRKAGSVGAEMRVAAPAFSSPEPVSAKTPRKKAAPASVKTGPHTAAKATRGRVAAR